MADSSRSRLTATGQKRTLAELFGPCLDPPNPRNGDFLSKEHSKRFNTMRAGLFLPIGGLCWFSDRDIEKQQEQKIDRRRDAPNIV